MIIGHISHKYSKITLKSWNNIVRGIPWYNYNDLKLQKLNHTGNIQPLLQDPDFIWTWIWFWPTRDEILSLPPQPKRIYPKRYHSQSAPQYHQTPRETMSDALKWATSFAGNESSLKLNNLQSTFKPIWPRHNCPLILDSNPNISKHFRKYLATLMIQATYSGEAKWTLNEWTRINVLSESTT